MKVFRQKTVGLKNTRMKTIIDIFKSAFDNFQFFLIAWIIIVVLNQVFFFHGCFKAYCISAALLHTGIIAMLITYFVNYENTEDENNE